MSSDSSGHRFSPVSQVREASARANLEYKLQFRQQPRQGRMCGIGEKVDRRPIDPPPIIQLDVIDHAEVPPKAPESASARRKGKGRETAQPASSKSFLQNPYFFMNATLTCTSPETQTTSELNLLKDGKTRYIHGSNVSSLFSLKDIDNTESGFFVFPDLGVRVEGVFRLKFDLYEIVGHQLHFCQSTLSDPFNVYSAKKFPGVQESTDLSRSISAQGIKIRLHNRQQSAATSSQPSSSQAPRLPSTSSNNKRKPSNGSTLSSSSSGISSTSHHVQEHPQHSTPGHTSQGGWGSFSQVYDERPRLDHRLSQDSLRSDGGKRPRTGDEGLERSETSSSRGSSLRSLKNGGGTAAGRSRPSTSASSSNGRAVARESHPREVGVWHPDPQTHNQQYPMHLPPSSSDPSFVHPMYRPAAPPAPSANYHSNSSAGPPFPHRLPTQSPPGFAPHHSQHPFPIPVAPQQSHPYQAPRSVFAASATATSAAPSQPPYDISNYIGYPPPLPNQPARPFPASSSHFVRLEMDIEMATPPQTTSSQVSPARLASQHSSSRPQSAASSSGIILPPLSSLASHHNQPRPSTASYSPPRFASTTSPYSSHLTHQRPSSSRAFNSFGPRPSSSTSSSGSMLPPTFPPPSSYSFDGSQSHQPPHHLLERSSSISSTVTTLSDRLSLSSERSSTSSLGEVLKDGSRVMTAPGRRFGPRIVDGGENEGKEGGRAGRTMTPSEEFRAFDLSATAREAEKGEEGVKERGGGKGREEMMGMMRRGSEWGPLDERRGEEGTVVSLNSPPRLPGFGQIASRLSPPPLKHVDSGGSTSTIVPSVAAHRPGSAPRLGSSSGRMGLGSLLSGQSDSQENGEGEGDGSPRRE